MSQRILLYGATGFSGRLIADWALKRGDALVLASRDARALRRQAAAVKMAHIAFGLDDRRRVLRVLEGFDVVINAAGPFNQTAERLAKAAIETSCSYVDINGEIDVYKTLDDLGDSAERRGVTLVCGAGHTATISDILLDSALTELPADDIGAVRIAVSRSLNLSRGSTLTMLRSIREQVTIVRAGIDPDSGARTKELRLTHVPVGRLERTFDFSMQHDSEQQAPRFGRLNHLGELLRIHKNIPLGIAAATKLHHRLESQSLLSDPRVPIRIPWHHSRIRMQRHTRQPSRSTSRRAEEINKYALFRHGVLIREDTHRPGIAQNFQQRTSRFILEYWPVP